VPLEGGALSAGDRVVAVGSRDLEDGDPVRVENADARSSSAASPAGPASLETE
jgi:hypothetical protein